MSGRRLHGDEGMVTAFVAILAVSIIFVTGLVLDGGYVLAAKREANNLAEQAARAGAQHVDAWKVENVGGNLEATKFHT